MESNSLNNWNRPEYAQEYRDHSDYYIPERRTLARVIGSYASAFLGSLPRPRLLDLGCGDGAVSETLLRALPKAEIVAADGSADMIAAARVRLTGAAGRVPHSLLRGNHRERSFRPGLRRDLLRPRHPSSADGRKGGALPRAASALKFGGHFLNVDVVTSLRRRTIWIGTSPFGGNGLRKINDRWA